MTNLSLRDHILRRATRFQVMHEQRGHPALARVRAYAQPLPGNAVVFSDLESKVDDVGDGLLAVDESSMSAGFVISSTRRDRHGDVVLPRGCEKSLSDYEKNPQVFFSHKSDCLPIARACTPDGKLALWVSDDKLTSRAYFHGKTQESDDVFGLVAAGYLKATSIGFVPVLGEIIPAALSQDELEAAVAGEGDLDFDLGGVIFKEWNLLEWSVVPVPANPDALRSLLSSTKKLSPAVRKGLEPFATVLRADRRRFFPAARFNEPIRLTTSLHKALTRMPRPDDDFHNPEESPNQSPKPEAGHREEAAQAVILHVSRFHEEAECVQWLEENGFKADTIIAGDEADEPFVALQFDADECDPSTAKRETIENGVEAVFCKRTAASNDDDSHREPYTDRPDGNPGPTELAMSSKINKAGDMLPEGPAGFPEAGTDAELPEDKVGKKPKEKSMPYGAEVHRKMHGHLCAMCGTCEEAMELLEHPKVKKNLEKLHKMCMQQKEALEAFHESEYPDHPLPAAGDEVEEQDSEDGSEEVEDDVGDENEHEDSEAPSLEEEPADDENEDGLIDEEDTESEDDPAADDEASEDDEEDEDEGPKKPFGGKKKPKPKPGKKKPVLADERSVKILKASRSKAITRKDAGVITEAADFLTELSTEDNLKRSQRKACKHYAEEVRGVVSNNAAVSSEVVEERDVSQDIEVLKELAELQEAYYELTGQEL